MTDGHPSVMQTEKRKQARENSLPQLECATLRYGCRLAVKCSVTDGKHRVDARMGSMPVRCEEAELTSGRLTAKGRSRPNRGGRENKDNRRHMRRITIQYHPTEPLVHLPVYLFDGGKASACLSGDSSL